MSSLRFERVIIPLVRELLMTVLDSKCQVYRRISQGKENWDLFFNKMTFQSSCNDEGGGLFDKDILRLDLARRIIV
jgi:hypothetical protein